MEQEVQKELMWASGALVAFLAFLVFSGADKITEIGISVGAFTVSWAVISYSVKNFGLGSTSEEDLQKEFQWFIVVLVIVLAILTLMGTNDDNISFSTYIAVVFGFTLVWVIRSAAIKYFSK